MSQSELINARATELVARLRKQDITPLDLLDALEARIAAVDKNINALPILCFGRARDHARRLMQKPVSERGLLAGMPVAIKDLTYVAGVRTTSGSRIFADYVPETTDLTPERLEAEGAIIYAKSNTPEFGAGANTFNDVFGATLKSMEHRNVRGRFFGWCSGGAGDRHGLARARLRRRRLLT